MEPLRQRRSKICIAARPIVTAGASSSSGNGQKQRQGNLGNLSPESSSCSGCTTEEDLLMLDFGRKSSKQASVLSGTPMKKLLAKEMLREAEVKSQSPGVIAKLMGLDGIPSLSQQNSGRRQMEDHHLIRKVERVERSGNISSRGSSRRSSRDEQEFKDVFEVTECTKLRSCDRLPPGMVEPKMGEAEMAFIRQKFLDAKRLSSDHRLQDSKEFDETLEVLDSNKDLLLKFLQQPDPLFTKHIHDLQGTNFKSHWSNNVTAGKLASDRGYETQSPSSKSLRENVPRKRGKSARICQNSRPSQAAIASNSTSYKSTKQESPTAPYTLPTRIVVLKPLMGMGQDTPEANFSPSRQSLLSDFDVPLEFVSLKRSETKIAERKRSSDQSKKPRAIAREIIRKARSTNSSIGSVSMASSRHAVCAGDESSSTMSLDEFAYDSDRTSASINSPNRNKKYESLPSVESSVCKEAKRRLSARWKLAHKSREKGEASKGSTLAEMLAIPDRLLRCPDLHKVAQQGLHSGLAISAEPLGISSRDGWKDVDLAKLSRSRSLPASSTSLRSATSRYPRMSRSRHASCDFMETMPRETTRWEKHRPTKGNNNLTNSLAVRGSKYPCSERQSPCCKSGYSSDASAEVESTHGQFAIGPKEFDPPTQSPVEEQARVKPSPSTVSEAPSQQLDSSICFIDELLPQEPPCLVPENSPVAAHHSKPEPDSSSSKEADQPSPVSVLEAPFSDDFSSGSECFESLSADLHGLRVQLELLKLESRAYEEGSVFISGDDGAVDEPMYSLEGTEFDEPAENWEYSYVADMLIACGYVEDEPADIFIAKWQSPECPAGPSVFEELEKIYDIDGSSMSERKLLFDLINSGVQEIYLPLMDPHPWVMQPVSTVCPNWRKDLLRDIMMRLVTCRDRKAGKEVLDKALVNDTKWLNMGDDIVRIGKELAGLVESELLDELLAM